MSGQLQLRDTAKGCMMYQERASTPPEIRKFRRSTNLEPGRRFKHHGLVDDYDSMNLDEKIYGQTESNRTRIGASDLISHDKPTELERINMIKAEKVYKQQNREPLGKIPDRGYKLPDKYTIGKHIISGVIFLVVVVKILFV
jgi:EF-hand domain-containing family member B